MKRLVLSLGCVGIVLGLTATAVWSRGFGGGGARMGGGGGAARGGGMSGGFSGGARPAGGFGGGGGFSSGGFSGGGLSGAGYRPSAPQRPSTGAIGGSGRSGGGYGGSFAGGDRISGGAGAQRPGVVHMPGSDGGGMQLGGRPQLDFGGGINRSDLRPAEGSGVRPGAAGGGIQRDLPGAAGNRPAPGGGSTASLPGLGSSRSAAGGAGERINAGSRVGAGGAGTRIADGAARQGAGGAGTRFSADSVPQRHENLSGQFNQLKSNWGDGDWHSWTGPNGGQINHIGFWGPNGYWGHTGATGPNGGHWGHSTGIGAGGAYGRTTAWGPNGNVVTRGAAVGPNGAVAWAGGVGPAGYWSRSWGGWYNGYGPAWGNGRWDYLWNEYPVAMAFGATMWGLNAVAYTMGVSDYSNPYYDSGSYPVDYDQPLTGDPSYETAEAAETDPAADPLTQLFNQARDAFHQDQFEQALELTDQALQQAPRDAALNEFRSLCLFALGRYRESAATIHAVLAAGPGWDWTTMISLYSSQEVYTQQLRALEAAAGSDPRSADMRFLLAYHYLTADHPEAAVEMWRQVVQINPGDKLSTDLLAMYGPQTDAAPQPAALPPDLDKPAYSAEQLAGNWTAKKGDDSFGLKLGADGAFEWSFTHAGQAQTVTGAYALGGNNLVMQPDTGGTMLSTITLDDAGTLVFAPIGETEKLTFTK